MMEITSSFLEYLMTKVYVICGDESPVMAFLNKEKAEQEAKRLSIQQYEEGKAIGVAFAPEDREELLKVKEIDLIEWK